jgi:hypothetical protein
LRGNNARLHLKREVNARRVPRWGAGVVDSLDNRQGAASCMAMNAPPPSPSTGKVTGQTRVLFFRHAGKTSLILPPVGGLTAVIVVVARRRKEYHVVATVEGHELEAPKTEFRLGLERLLETPHLELDGKLFVNTQQAPTWRASCRCFDPGVPGPTSKLSLRVPAQMGRRETETQGGKNSKGEPTASCCPAPRADVLAVGGYKHLRGRERRGALGCPFSRAATFLYESPGPSFYRRKERVQVYNGGCSSVLTCLAERS